MTPPPETPSPTDPAPTPVPATNDAPPAKKSNSKKKKNKNSSSAPPANTTTAEAPTESAPPAATEPSAVLATTEPTGTAPAATAVPPLQAAPGEEDGGLFGGWTAGLTEGMNQLWGSVSGEGEQGMGNANSATGGENTRSTGNTAGEGEDGSSTPLRSPALIPLSKAAAELENAGKAAQIRLGKAAQEVERGWGAFNSFLDEFLSPPIESEDGTVSGTRSGGGIGSMGQKQAYENAGEKLHERFPALDAAEEAVEVYECSLIQKYKSALNDATPEKTFAFSGVLYITPAHIAMYVVDDNSGNGKKEPFGIVVPLADVKRVQRGSKAMLRIVTADKNSYVFASFANEDAFKATVELLHHLVGADETKNSTPAQAPAAEEQPVGQEKTATD